MTDIEKLLTADQMDAIYGANSPSGANVFATMADLIADTSIYTGNGTVGSGRIATVTDVLTFTDGTTRRNDSSVEAYGTVSIFEGAGINAIGFADNGRSTYITITDRWAYDAAYEYLGEVYTDNSVNDTTKLDGTRFFMGTNWGTATASTYGQWVWSKGAAMTGFALNEFGERIMSQSAGLNYIGALDISAGIAFLSGSGGTGYIGVANQAGFASWMGVTLDQTLAEVLTTGNVTGTNDISITDGQGIVFNTVAGGPFTGTLSNAVLTANHTYTLQNGSGTLAFLTDIPAADGSLYANNGTVLTSRVATLTDNLTFKDGTVIIQGVGTDETSDVLRLEKLGGVDVFRVTDDARITSAFTGDIDAGVAARSYVWNMDAAITERSGGDGYSVYQFASTFAGANASNWYRTMFVQAPTGGVNPAAAGGRIAISATAFQSAGGADDNFKTIYAQTGNAVNRQSAIQAHIVQGLAAVNNTAVYAYLQPGAQGIVKTSTGKAVHGQISISDALHTGAMYGAHFFVSRTAAGSGFNIGMEAASIGTNSTNIAIRVRAAQGDVVIGATAPLAGTKLTVRGNGTLTANTVAFAGSTGVNHFLVNDSGQIGTRAGGGASINASFAQYHQTTGYAYGFGLYANNATSAGMFIAMQGTTRTGLSVSTQNSPVGGTVTSISGNTIGALSAQNVGVLGQARNGSNYSIGVQGVNQGGASVTPTGYVAAVAGNSAPNIDAIQYAGYFLSNSGFAGLKTKDIIAVYGAANNSSNQSASTSTAIGAQFRTGTIGGGGSNKNMALNIPASANDGNFVVGADASSANRTLVEVTGDIEIIGTGAIGQNGIILESPDGSRWRATMTDLGAWSILAA